MTMSPDDAQRLVLGALAGLPEPGEMRKLPGEEWTKIDAPALRDPETGRPDAVRIDMRLGFSQAQMAEILGTSPQTLSVEPSGEGLQVGLAPMARLLAMLDRVLAVEHQRMWINATRSDLGERTALQCIRDGDAVMVVELMEGALGGILD